MCVAERAKIGPAPRNLRTETDRADMVSTENVPTDTLDATHHRSRRPRWTLNHRAPGAITGG
ncbi:hypothetical protein F4561_003466 [Lipingzhangella halophila]|uniref:Uncharacterized protein n=1 Tax=Lipingzhangella halophila TaxID=1783352 RepID=A0A7W7RIH2_9ACTN|nr:hypothetical protein [Lipingzhangella halophila]